MEITKQNIQEFLDSNKEKVVFIEYGAEWCPPCRMIKPILKDLSETKSDVMSLGLVDIDVQSELAIDKGIKAIPVVEIYKNGELVETLKGAASKTAYEGYISKYSK